MPRAAATTAELIIMLGERRCPSLGSVDDSAFSYFVSQRPNETPRTC